MISFFELFLIFVKIGAILLGGGYVILPIIISEFAKKRQLVSEDEIVNYFALSQSLPGIIAANISMFIGYKLKGRLGAVLAMLGIITVPFLCIILLASVLDKLVDNSIVNGIFWGVGVSVIALILLTIREMWQKSTRNGYFYFVFLAAFASLLLLDFSPIKTILVYGLVGVLYKKFIEKEEISQ